MCEGFVKESQKFVKKLGREELIELVARRKMKNPKSSPQSPLYHININDPCGSVR